MMDPYVERIFKLCQNHPMMERLGFEISGQTTNCSKVETNHMFKGICIPYEYNCKTNTDCPILVLKNEDTDEDLPTAAYCSNQNICTYNLR